MRTRLPPPPTPLTHAVDGTEVTVKWPVYPYNCDTFQLQIKHEGSFVDFDPVANDDDIDKDLGARAAMSVGDRLKAKKMLEMCKITNMLKAATTYRMRLVATDGDYLVSGSPSALMTTGGVLAAPPPPPAPVMLTQPLPSM